MPNIARFFARLDGHLHRFGTIIETNVVLYLSAPTKAMKGTMEILIIVTCKVLKKS